jgi:hypothetical protein
LISGEAVEAEIDDLLKHLGGGAVTQAFGASSATSVAQYSRLEIVE